MQMRSQGSEFRVGPPALGQALALPAEVAAVQQVAVRGPDLPVERGILGRQAWEPERRLVDEEL